MLAGVALVDRRLGPLVGAATFLAYRIALVRRLLCRDHRSGLASVARGEIEPALEHFRRSEAVWRGRRRMDSARAILLGSGGPYDYLTLARYNQAYCLALLERHEPAIAIVDELLGDDPENRLALDLRAALIRTRARDA